MTTLIRTAVLMTGMVLVGGCRTRQHAMPQPTPLRVLAGSDACTRCSGYLLPGRAAPSDDAVLRVDSDLPEIFLSTGVLYSTAPVLPPFLTKDRQEVPESQRRQRNAGFNGITDDFEVFLYHMSNPGELPRERRVLVWVWNRGERSAIVEPRQIMESHGTMAKADGPESRLSVRTLEDRWDHPVGTMTIPPGEGRVIGWSPRLSVPHAKPGDTDASPSDFFTGVVRARVRLAEGGAQHANLELAVVAIDGGVGKDGFDSACREAMGRGAWSGEGAMDLRIPPPECHVRRVVGVFKNFEWVSDEVVIDVGELKTHQRSGAGPGLSFLMAAPKVQTVGCPEARQTEDMLLSPGYVHAETIGNYQIEYRVVLTLVNRSDKPERVDVRFGKQDADIGLAWRVHVSDQPAPDQQMKGLPVNVQWAGGWRTDDLGDNTRSLFMPAKGEPGEKAEERPIEIPPGKHATVTLRFMPVGTSSLPFHLHVVSVE